ncbi:hypothetical protein SUDANB95_07910 (plasmid) [Actinosynnema sp. ALI-1.44]
MSGDRRIELNAFIAAHSGIRRAEASHLRDLARALTAGEIGVTPIDYLPLDRFLSDELRLTGVDPGWASVADRLFIDALAVQLALIADPVPRHDGGTDGRREVLRATGTFAGRAHAVLHALAAGLGPDSTTGRLPHEPSAHRDTAGPVGEVVVRFGVPWSSRPGRAQEFLGTAWTAWTHASAVSWDWRGQRPHADLPDACRAEWSRHALGYGQAVTLHLCAATALPSTDFRPLVRVGGIAKTAGVLPRVVNNSREQRFLRHGLHTGNSSMTAGKLARQVFGDDDYRKILIDLAPPADPAGWPSDDLADPLNRHFILNSTCRLEWPDARSRAVRTAGAGQGAT